MWRTEDKMQPPEERLCCCVVGRRNLADSFCALIVHVMAMRIVTSVQRGRLKGSC